MSDEIVSRANAGGRGGGSRACATLRLTATLVGGSVVLAQATACLGGGCYTVVEAVQLEPATNCLELFGGASPEDPIACGLPQLKGVNHCDVALVLPARGETDSATTFGPEQKVQWAVPDNSRPPGIEVHELTDERRTYVIHALLGDDKLAIVIPTRTD